MPPRHNRVSRARHGTKNLILQVLESTRTSKAISTPDLIERVQGLSETKIPEPTIRAALRTQIEKRVVLGRRKGHTMYLRLIKYAEAPAVPTASELHHAGKLPEVDQVAEAHATATASVGEVPPSQALTPQHKLAVGEALILHVGESHVETATNVHGKIVLEKHPRPKV